jgi:hypothetical protein
MRTLVAAVAFALLAACAPDSIRRDREFETWLGEMRQACERARIGTTTVGGLLNSTGSREGNNFLNFTSRLYAGQIDADTWTNNVVSFLRGRSSDPGVQCVLERVPKR